MKKNRNNLIFFLIFMIMPLSLFVISNRAENSPQMPNASFYLTEPNIYTHIPSRGVIDSAGRNILYWVQVSDVHIDMRWDDLRTKFEQLCDDINKTIKPAFVISTGDQVEARSIISEDDQHYQYEAEYQFFNQTIANYDFTPENWFSGVGNHERYNSQFNWSLFHYYIRNESQYGFDIVTSFGKYRFIMADTTQEYGLRNNYCLFGEMKKEKLDHLESLIQLGDLEEINQTVFAGHHSLNMITSEKSSSGKSYIQLIQESNASIYLCGHTHFPNLYAHHGDFSELLCPSWVDHYSYRICAFDNDLFSFSEQKAGQWPAALITSPMDGRWLTEKMPIERLNTLSEIRVLVFDPADALSITAKAYVNDVEIGSLSYQGDNLWTLNWDPNDYNDGNGYELTVNVTSPSGTSIQKIPFKLAGKTPMRINEGLTQLMISFPVISVLISLIIGLSIFSILRLVIPKIYFVTHKDNFRGKTPQDFDREGASFAQKTIHKMYFQSATLPISLFIILIIMAIYPLIGPYAIGPLSSNIFGYHMIYGIQIGGTYVLSIYSLIYSLVLVLASLFLQNYVFMNNKDSSRKDSIVFLLIVFGVAGFWMFVINHYFGFRTIFINPVPYIYILVPLICILILKKHNR